MLQRGIGLLVPSDPGSGPSLVLQTVGAVVGVPADALAYLNAWWGFLITRAPSYPGTQVARMAEAAPAGCSPDPTAPAFTRCWTMRATVDDAVLDVMVQLAASGAEQPDFVPKHFTLHMLGVDLMYGSPMDRTGAADMMSSDGASVNVTSGPQMAQALADPSVTTIIVLTAVLNITNADYDSWSPMPVRVDRNVTITAPDGSWPVLVFNAVKKVVIGDFVTVLLRGVVAKPAFNQIMLRYPQVSLFAQSSPRSRARLVLQDAAIWLDYGLDGAYGVVWMASLPRPTDSPGLQVINGDYAHNPGTCVNDSSVPPRQRCWAGSGTFVDVIVPAIDVDRYSGVTYPLYYTGSLFNTSYFFSKVLPEECLKQSVPVDCYIMLEAAARPAAAGPPPAPLPGPPPTGAPSLQQEAAASSSSMPIIVGAVVGGVGLLFLLAGAAFFWAGAHRRREAAPAADAKGCDARGWSNALHSFLSSTTTLTPTIAAATPTQPSSRISSSRAGAGPSGSSGASPSGATAATAASSTTGALGLTEGRPIGIAAPSSAGLPWSTAGASSGAGTRGASGVNTPLGVGSSGLSNNLRPGLSPAGGRSPEFSQTATASPAALVPGSAARSSPLVLQQDSSDAVIHSTPFRHDLDIGVQIKDDGASAGEPDKTPWEGSRVAYNSTGTTGTGFGRTVPVFAVLGSAAGSSVKAAAPGHPNGSVGGGARARAAAAAADTPAGSAGGGSSDSPAASASSTVVQLLPTVLGKGAFGRVVEGLYHGQLVAVKLLLTAVDASAGTKDEHTLSFVQEIECLGRCEHPNIIKLMAACVLPPQMALVMERMEGSLERLVFGGRRPAGGQAQPSLLPLPKLLHIAIQIAQGIAYLHPTIVHRDLKPANVLINGGDGDFPVVKLSDFGLARMRMFTLPTQNIECGTPSFMAPELFDVSNDVVSHRADMYSFAVVLWVMLTGQQPWKEWNLVAIAYNVSRGIRLPLDGIDPQRCPPKMKRLITACWDADPQRRPAAAEALKELLLIQEQIAMAGATSSSSDPASAPPVAPEAASAAAPAPGDAAGLEAVAASSAGTEIAPSEVPQAGAFATP
ncbi:hypothetical protein HXX76_008147 [Chlamydomonas incerta]|uniref:Protein kinase domain-containing protein n=1 Tax=Chlamydomonas incerta TaxID=51695 RepID=A0A835T4P6_CHLIN|nr:hypothetical protein HXX76_008147 [Chlamydomonas incerta]|eukprot:KAG2433789.1 hypothetical protein HXX76_008147 [Chlamydomonas incerta]